jgi:hypothetical protein
VQADPLPCPDLRGCPDLVVDDLQLGAGGQVAQSFAADDCAVHEGAAKAGLRQMLWFSTANANLGLGDFFPDGPATDPDRFEWDPCHGHWHFKAFAEYRLWTPEAFQAWDGYRLADPSAPSSAVLAAHPELLDGLVTGAKRGFCLTDIAPALPNRHAAPVVPDPLPKYGGCESNQGISVGWSDIYPAGTEGQWIDVTDVAPGPYILEAENNAEHVYGETDFSNNRGWLPVAVAPGPGNNGVVDAAPAVEDAIAQARGLLPDFQAGAEAEVAADVDGQAFSGNATASTDEGAGAWFTTPAIGFGASLNPIWEDPF